MANTHGLAFVSPSDFENSEVMVCMTGPAVNTLREPRAMQAQFPIRPNMIVHRRAAPEDSSLEMVTGELCAELMTTIAGLKNLNTEPMKFSDDADGSLVSFDFPAGKAATVRQFQAVRLKDGNLWTMTLTVDSSALSDDSWAGYKASLTSLGV